jgi:hypothetical protein
VAEATDVRLEFLPPAGGFGPTVALSYVLPDYGVWQETVLLPAHVVLPGGESVRLTPARGHPRHTVFPVVTESPRRATFVWDARKDGFDPSRESWIRTHLEFRMAYANLVCHQSPVAPAPESPPHVPPKPTEDQEPPTPPPDPSNPGSGPIVPIDIGNPVAIPEEHDTGILLDGGVVDESDGEYNDVIVPGMPDPSDVGDAVTEAPLTDSVPEDPAPSTGTIPESPPVTGGSGLPLDENTVDESDELAPDIIEVPDTQNPVTEDPERSGDEVSHGGEQPGDLKDPGQDPGSSLPYPNAEGPAGIKWPETINPYEAPLFSISTAGKDEFLDGNTSIPLHLEVLPYSIIPYGANATVVMGVENQTATPYSNVGLLAEFIDGEGNRTTVGISPERDIPGSGTVAESFALESAYFLAAQNDTGVLRAYLIDPDLTCRGFIDRNVYFESEPVMTADIPEQAPMTVGTAGVAVLLEPFTLANGVTVKLNYGTFDGSGARTATISSSTEPLKTSNGILIDPDSHHVILKDLSVTIGTWYWVEVERLTGAASANHNFTLYGGGFRNPNLSAMPDFNAAIQVASDDTVVHPRNALTALTVDGSSHLNGSLHLPYEGEYYMVVNERTSEAVVVEAVNNTDVQTNALPGGARMVAQVGDAVVVFRMGSDHDMDVVGRFMVNGS